MSRSSKFAITLFVLAFASLACNFSVNIPVQKITTIPTQTEDINLPAPGSPVANLALSFSAGNLNLQPGAQNALVSGTATYNVQELKPKITTSANRVILETGDLKIKGLPSSNNQIINTWDLKLGDMPQQLTINAGAYQGDFELGGISLNSLEINDGAANVRMRFSQPNKVEMDSLTYTTGASNVEMKGLGNANFASMIFRSGAGSYTLDFSGSLKRDAAVTIESGMSHMILVIPQGVSAKVIFQGGMSSIHVPEGWSHSGSTYSQAGSGPTLTVHIDMGAGDVELRSQ